MEYRQAGRGFAVQAVAGQLSVLCKPLGPGPLSPLAAAVSHTP